MGHFIYVPVLFFSVLHHCHFSGFITHLNFCKVHLSLFFFLKHRLIFKLWFYFIQLCLHMKTANSFTLFLNPNQASSVQFSCLVLSTPLDCSTPGIPVPHHLLKLAQVHVHYVGDGIQLSFPLMPSSLSALNLPQLQGLFQ